MKNPRSTPLIAVAALGVITVAALTLGSNEARADSTCVPQDPWTEVVTPAQPAVPGQHYSLKGNSGIDKYEVPVFPADYWQANTEQEPHGSQNVTWYPTDPATSGLHYMSHGSQGLRDWFYYAAPQPAVPAVVIEHPAVTCPEEPTPTPSETPTVPTPTTPTETPSTPDVPTETTPVTPSQTPEVTLVPTPTTEPSETPESTPEGAPEAPEEDADEPTSNPPVKSTPPAAQPPKNVATTVCQNGQWVTLRNGQVIAKSGTCAETPENTTPTVVEEQGL